MVNNESSTIKFSIPKMEDGGTHLEIKYEDKTTDFWITNFIDCGFLDLMETLCLMYPDSLKEALEYDRCNRKTHLTSEKKSGPKELYRDLDGREDVYLTISAIPGSELPYGNVKLEVDGFTSYSKLENDLKLIALPMP